MYLEPVEVLVGSIQSGNNVDIWADNDAEAQEFIIEFEGFEIDADNSNLYRYYSIRLKSNPNLVLTSYGLGNGSGSGTTSTSNGNVFISTYTGAANQMWFFETFTTYAAIELLDWDLVDSGKHLDWSGTSKYLTQFKNAVNIWNNYKSGVIREDTISTINDVTISDQDLGEDGVLGVTNQLGTIIFNTRLLDTKDSYIKLNTCIHELGHALGLAHKSARGSIMQNFATRLNVLSYAEKNTYDYAYNNKY